ncbi:hypothetical protein K402DRAFT_425826 [Aulographum hederae CBS 113979]|uniref:Uncharacterized protein n=1 Tax=Aulographum hederae CBS 113979 TaxID=1176131 RepID=A0A6G1GIZ3_9PEZI|nr:hypothetical protein K402DRAFT_425826 [Aulographum hederae CBS 113979]
MFAVLHALVALALPVMTVRQTHNATAGGNDWSIRKNSKQARALFPRHDENATTYITTTSTTTLYSTVQLPDTTGLLNPTLTEHVTTTEYQTLLTTVYLPKVPSLTSEETIPQPSLPTPEFKFDPNAAATTTITITVYMEPPATTSEAAGTVSIMPTELPLDMTSIRSSFWNQPSAPETTEPPARMTDEPSAPTMEPTIAPPTGIFQDTALPSTDENTLPPPTGTLPEPSPLTPTEPTEPPPDDARGGEPSFIFSSSSSLIMTDQTPEETTSLEPTPVASATPEPTDSMPATTPSCGVGLAPRRLQSIHTMDDDGYPPEPTEMDSCAVGAKNFSRKKNAGGRLVPGWARFWSRKRNAMDQEKNESLAGRRGLSTSSSSSSSSSSATLSEASSVLVRQGQNQIKDDINCQRSSDPPFNCITPRPRPDAGNPVLPEGFHGAGMSKNVTRMVWAVLGVAGLIGMAMV